MNYATYIEEKSKQDNVVKIDDSTLSSNSGYGLQSSLMFSSETKKQPASLPSNFWLMPIALAKAANLHTTGHLARFFIALN